MVLTKEERAKITQDFAIRDNDTGSPEVQVALLTNRILYMTEHLKMHKKDKHSRRGLQLMVSHRTRLLKYLKKKDFGRYSRLIKRLGLRR